MSRTGTRQRGNSAEGWFTGSMRWRYESRLGDLFALSWASCLRVCLGNSFSDSSTSGDGYLSILLFGSAVRCCVTACVWINFLSCSKCERWFVLWWVVWSVMRLSKLLKIVFFMIRGGWRVCRRWFSGWSGLVASCLRLDECAVSAQVLSICSDYKALRKQFDNQVSIWWI